MIPYGRQYISPEDEKAVLEALRADFLTQGPAVSEFETQFAKYVGSKYAVAVTNGTAALHLSAIALNVTLGDKIIVPANTFVASANCILYCGGEVEFVDINPKTYCIDLVNLEEMLKAKPKGYYKGVIAVDFAGYAVNLETLNSLAKKYELWIIEDACHAPGAAFKNSKGLWQRCGNGISAELAIFSFHPVKHIACGEGGMVTTNDEKLYERLKLLRTHGITKNPSEMSKVDGGWYYEMKELGFNYRMPDVLCALGSSQLKRADERLRRRQEIAKLYDECFKGSRVIIPYRASDVDHAFHLYVIKVDNRKKCYDHLREKQIFPQVHYIPVYDQPFYQKKYGTQSLPESSQYYQGCLSLPMYPELTDEQIRFVADSVKESL